MLLGLQTMSFRKCQRCWHWIPGASVDQRGNSGFCSDDILEITTQTDVASGFGAQFVVSTFELGARSLAEFGASECFMLHSTGPMLNPNVHFTRWLQCGLYFLYMKQGRDTNTLIWKCVIAKWFQLTRHWSPTQRKPQIYEKIKIIGLCYLKKKGGSWIKPFNTLISCAI